MLALIGHTEVLIIVIVCLISLAIYLIPTIIAKVKRKRNLSGIALLNIFTGWSMVGWIISLVWAVSPDRQQKEE